ncbi:alkaline phosphatase family protein [Vibrio sp. JPW-9-11-11]|uniref:alkaline phosphatase D family protein n=1 Tax=Vibrio sp. JPW-9-11-11 TaxID=1416532 RepID=UPI0015935EA4|nr:alkaline phosphatase D family protein [Vibrio sp. JPW-9-11-11]NVD06886.1 alkaline phosphatase family protein [Vibrio sp. JPW-9-11-11]
MPDSPPFLIAGPILRKAAGDELVFWLVTREPLKGEFTLCRSGQVLFRYQLEQLEPIQVGKQCFVTLAQFKGQFPLDCTLSYQFDTQFGSLSERYPHLLYPGESELNFTISSKADYVMHGSCRNPHYPSDDALVRSDEKVAALTVEERPDLLMMSGDQIYADHVAGPMLDAIIQTIELLGLPNERFKQAPVSNSQSLYTHPDCYYGRDRLLPHHYDDGHLLTKLFPKRNAPIFTSTDAENHLVTFSEFFAMYLLVWSPTLWPELNLGRLRDNAFEHAGHTLTPELQQRWHDEHQVIRQFVAGLDRVQRLFAHIPTYMIFDDHDITDDWNLTIGWEMAAYGNPFSKRIIGNGLIAYWLCQGWGNEPSNFSPQFVQRVKDFLTAPDSNNHDHLIDHLYRFEQWHYTIERSPKVVVLDTRTRRWRSESRMNKPSGLMDWEAMVELQQALLHQDKVIIVSAAPMFGVKFIETLQRIVTALGKPLMVDAENWMAHRGSANTLLSIFTHTKTPTNFVILSGDVHYSFAYDITLRFRRNSPNIYQVTCSGLKSQFPEPLLALCDHADRLLYSPRSPLNWFTKRKRLKVKKRNPNTPGRRRLVNSSAIGELKLDAQGKPQRISILTGDGDEWEFLPIKEK